VRRGGMENGLIKMLIQKLKLENGE